MPTAKQNTKRDMSLAVTFQAISARLVLALASIFGFDVWSSDVKLGYLQSTEPFVRRFLIKNIPPGFELTPNERFELLPPLCELSDSGELCHLTLHKKPRRRA